MARSRSRNATRSPPARRNSKATRQAFAGERKAVSGNARRLSPISQHARRPLYRCQPSAEGGSKRGRGGARTRSSPRGSDPSLDQAVGTARASAPALFTPRASHATPIHLVLPAESGRDPRPVKVLNRKGNRVMPNKPALRFSRDCNRREPAAAGRGQRPVFVIFRPVPCLLLCGDPKFALGQSSGPRVWLTAPVIWRSGERRTGLSAHADRRHRRSVGGDHLGRRSPSAFVTIMGTRMGI